MIAFYTLLSAILLITSTCSVVKLIYDYVWIRKVFGVKWFGKRNTIYLTYLLLVIILSSKILMSMVH
jgi:hypothetical protein